MLIGVKRRFVFIANTKTGSTSIEKLLMPYAEINRGGSPQRKHISWKDVRIEYSFLFDDLNYEPESFFKFGVIRDPVDWVRSWYNYRLNNQKVDNPLPPDMSFEDFWRAPKNWVREARQSTAFLDSQGQCAMDLIIPLEYLPEAMKYVLERLGIPHAPMPKENKSPGKLKRSDIGAENEREILSQYAEDAAMYDCWKRKWECGHWLAAKR